MTTTDMTTTSGDMLAPQAVAARIEYAKALAASSLLPDAYRQQPANLLLAIEYGQALGLTPIAAVQGISVIKGKPTLSADLMAAVVRRAGHKLRIREHDNAVTAELIRKDDPEFVYSATWDEAKARTAGLWGQRGPWSNFPTQMMRSRAVTEVCRQGASDCLAGCIYAPDELATTTVPDETSAPQPAPKYADQRVGFVARWLAENGHDGDDPAAVLAAVPEEEAHDPKRMTAWLVSVYASDLANTAGTADEVVQGELIEEVTDGE